MCKYCDPSKHGVCEPMAVNMIGKFKVPIVLYVKNENTGKIELNVNFDGEEPLLIESVFCQMCGRKLND